MFSANYILKICIFLSVLVYFTHGSKSQSEEKKINIKIGFDLTQGENGAPSLRIRDFEKESPEVHARASNDKDGPLVRADSFSENSDEKDDNDNKPKESQSKEAARQGSKSKESSSEADSDEKRGISTRGMDAGEYEPEAARLGKEKPTDDNSKSKESSSGEESASGGDKEEIARRHQQGARPDADARRHDDAPRRAKRSVPNLKGLMENIRKRTRELFVADRRQAEMKTKTT